MQAFAATLVALTTVGDFAIASGGNDRNVTATKNAVPINLGGFLMSIDALPREAVVKSAATDTLWPIVFQKPYLADYSYPLCDQSF